MFFLIFPLATISIFLPLFERPNLTHYLLFSFWVSISFVICRKKIKNIDTLTITLLSIILIFTISALINDQNLVEAVIGKSDRNLGIGSIFIAVCILLIIQNSNITISDFSKFALWPLTIITITFGILETFNKLQLNFMSNSALELYTGNINYSAQILSMLTLFHILQLRRSKMTLKSYINLMCILTLIFLGVKTESTQFYSLVIGTLLILYFFYNFKTIIMKFSDTRLKLLITTSTFVFFGIFIAFFEKISIIINLKDRLLDIKTGTQIGLDNWLFGVGIERLHLVSPMYRSLEKNLMFDPFIVTDKSHNVFIDYFAEGGIFIFILFTFFIVLSLLYIKKLGIEHFTNDKKTQFFPLVAIWLIYVQQLFYSTDYGFSKYLSFCCLGFIVREFNFNSSYISVLKNIQSVTKNRLIRVGNLFACLFIIFSLITNSRLFDLSFKQNMILSKKVIDIVDLRETFKNSKNLKFKESLVVNLLRDKRNCPLIKEFSSNLIESEPRFWNAYYFMALCEDAEGNYRVSIQYINSGLSYYPSNAQMLEARFLLEVRLSLIDDAKNTLNLIKYYKPNYQGIMDLERALISIPASQVPDS